MSARRSRTVGVVVERRKARARGSISPGRPVTVLAGRAGCAPWTVLSQRRRRTTFYAGTADDRALPPKPPTIATISHRARLRLGRVAADRGRAAVPRAGHRDPRKAKRSPKPATICCRYGADAGPDLAMRGGGFRRRASRRATGLQTQARSRRYGSHGAAAPGSEEDRNERSERLPDALACAETQSAFCGDACAKKKSRCSSGRQGRGGDRIDRSGVRHLRNFAVARIDHGQFRHQSLSFGVPAVLSRRPFAALEALIRQLGFCRSV